MQTVDIVSELRKLNLVIQLENQKLVISGEISNLPEVLLSEIKGKKDKIIEYLELTQNDITFDHYFISPAETYYPTTGTQKRFWLLSQFEKANAAYNIAIRFNLVGELNVSALQQSFDSLIKKHESMRTVFRLIDGELRQVIQPCFQLQLKELDISGMNTSKQKSFVEAEYKRIKNHEFDLANGPLIEAYLWKLSKIERVVIISMHHLISDGWSLGIIVKELLTNYGYFCKNAGFAEEPKVFQYRNYSGWQEKNKELLRSKHHEFWRNYIPQESVFLNLPLSFQRPAIKCFDGNKTRTYLGIDFYNEIKLFCNREGATMFNFFRATLTIYLAKISGQTIIPIGVPVSGRNNKLLEREIGLYINTLPLFSFCDDRLDFTEFLSEISNNSACALSHLDYPFDLIVSDQNLPSDRNRNPLFDVMMVFHDTMASADIMKVADVSELTVTSTDGWLYNYQDYELEDVGAQMDLSFIFGAEPGGHFYMDIEYCSKLFDRNAIQNLVQHYRVIIKQVLEFPLITLGDIKLLSAEDEKLLLEKFNATQHAFDEQATITDLFERRVLETPEAVAVMSDSCSMTYERLNETANKLANYIRSRYEVKPDTPIAIKMERGEWLLISILAVLKSGGAYIPISPDYPDQRVQFILNDSLCSIVIDLERIEDFESSQALYCKENLKPIHTPGNMAYIIYTSGSTGYPKGCMLEHRGIVNRFEWMWSELGFDRSEIILQKTTFTFDVSVWELLMPICYGCQMVLCKNEDVVSPERLAGLVSKYGVTCMHFVPSMLNAFLKFNFWMEGRSTLLESLKKVIVSGESLSSELARKWNKTTSIPLYNMYGPTEASIDVTSYKVLASDSIVPIGKPIWNTQVYILNEFLQLQPPGIVGDIYIGGIGLARGYINNSELTSEKFLPSPFFPEQRIYRTGDLGRWLPDGNIEFMGRKDDQVKIRGHRIELSEIESALKVHPDIKEAAVIVKKNRNDENEITAFIVSNMAFRISELRDYLGNTLPSFMLPENYLQLDSLPLTQSGKVDKQALRNTKTGNIETGTSYVEPTNDIEKALIHIWSQTLGREHVGTHDNFFDLGGNSLKVLSMVSLINDSIGVAIPVVKVFQFPTVSLLAKFITSGKSDIKDAEADEMRSKSVNVMEQTLSLINSVYND